MDRSDPRSGRELGEEAAQLLARLGGVEIGPSLTDTEFAAIEERHGFTFADDHRWFLAHGLPTGGKWPDWRDGDPDELDDRLRWPVDGVVFDVAHNGFWLPSWGSRPGDVTDAVIHAERRMESVPPLVPVYSHRYLPAGAGTFSHPVLSVMQTDIICYGADLVDYIRRERDPSIGMADAVPSAKATVEFWRDLIR